MDDKELFPYRFNIPKLTAAVGYTITDCYLGKMLVAMTEDSHIRSISLGATEEEVILDFRKLFNRHTVRASIDLSRLLKYIENPVVNDDIVSEFKLEPFSVGTGFQHDVWRILRSIPIGSTISYSEIAKKMGRPNSARAVAKACASNNIAILVPCHRVIRNDGALSGYHWGVEKKKALLQKEGIGHG